MWDVAIRASTGKPEIVQPELLAHAVLSAADDGRMLHADGSVALVGERTGVGWRALPLDVLHIARRTDVACARSAVQKGGSLAHRNRPGVATTLRGLTHGQLLKQGTHGRDRAKNEPYRPGSLRKIISGVAHSYRCAGLAKEVNPANSQVVKNALKIADVILGCGHGIGPDVFSATTGMRMIGSLNAGCLRQCRLAAMMALMPTLGLRPSNGFTANMWDLEFSAEAPGLLVHTPWRKNHRLQARLRAENGGGGGRGQGGRRWFNFGQRAFFAPPFLTAAHGAPRRTVR